MPIIDYEAKAKRLEREIFSSKRISKKNKDLLQRFLVSYDVSPARMSIFLERIRMFLEADSDVLDLIRDRDKVNYVFRGLRNKYAPATWNTYANVLIRFGRWLNDGKLPTGFQDVSKQRASKEKRSLDPGDMVSWKEGIALSERTFSTQLKAILLTQLDAGFRPSEFIDMNYGDVSVLDRVVVFHVKAGKTGSRDVVAYRSAPHFLKWYYSHPTKDPRDPLWIKEYAHSARVNEYEVERYEYAALRKRIRSLGFRCDFKKPLDFYNLRHSSCALDKIDNLPVELAADRHGHSVKYFTTVYGRLSTKDVINRFKRHYGERVEERGPANHVECPACGFPNASGEKVCQKCFSSLNVEKIANSATGKFKEVLKKESDLAAKEIQIAGQQEKMVDLDHRIREMDQVLRERQIEIDRKLEILRSNSREMAVREIELKLSADD